MGNHYIPRAYLRMFANDSGGVWFHDRKALKSHATKVENIGSEVGMYSEAVEENLNLHVEQPTLPVFQRVLSKQILSDAERSVLAKYITVMWKRVPTGRERALTRMPSVADDVHDNLMSEIDALIEAEPAFRLRGEEVRSKAKAYIEKVKEAPPAHLWYDSFNLTDEGRVEDALLSMNWVFLHSGKQQYLTSDNPVFFFEHEGIGSPLSELTFPISSSIALWATRRPVQNGLHADAVGAAVKQINRRTAYNSKRFVFSKENEPWIMPFVSKGEWVLERLLWQRPGAQR